MTHPHHELMRAPPRAPAARRRRASTAWLLFLVTLAILTGCTDATPATAPTATPVPTPAPRPTAETPAVVTAWSIAAQAEDEVRILADLTDREIEALGKELARRYPNLKPRWTRDRGDALLAAALATPRDGVPDWDIYIGDYGATIAAQRLAERWTPPEARGVPAALIDPEGAWYALAVTYLVLQYNTDQVPPASRPPTYDALMHPGYTGRIAIEDQNLTWLRGLIAIRGRDNAFDLLRGLSQQAVTMRRDARSLVAFVTAGADAVSIASRLDIVERERKGGGKTGWVGIEPVIVQPLTMVLAARTDRPNGARLAANYLLSPDAQRVLAEASRIPARADVDREPQSLARGLKTELTVPPYGADERELRTLWTQLWRTR